MGSYYLVICRKVLAWGIVYLVVCGFSCFNKTGITHTNPPNIVLIMADDLGYSDLGCYGGEIQTPNLDALAEKGLRFNRFYNAARCCPTRAALLTGLYPHQVGMGKMVSKIGQSRKSGPFQGYLKQRIPTIAEVLKFYNYSSYMSGKWHVGEDPEYWPLKRGFERYFGLISGASSYFEILKNQDRVRQMVLEAQLWEPPMEGFYMTDAITDYAVSCINEHVQSHENPFFLYVAYTAPHWPLHALPEDIVKYEGFYNIGWDSLRQWRYQKMLEEGIIDHKYVLSSRSESIPSWQNAKNRVDWSRRMTVYAAMVDRMDQGIGKIIRTLQNNSQLDQTIIFFLSDNGGCSEEITDRGLHVAGTPIGEKGSYVAYREPWANVSNTPFRLYKKWVHEGGIATPFIVSWPEKIRNHGVIQSQIGHVIDILPTCLEIAGGKYPESFSGQILEDLPGISLLSTFDGKTVLERKPLFWEHYGNKAVREGNWKLVAETNGAWELYNLAKDPTEQIDLAAELPDKVEELNAKYLQWYQSITR